MAFGQDHDGHEEREIAALKAEIARLREALKAITDCYCTCTGYYKCNGCELKAVHIAEDALAALQPAKEGKR